jgi:hypothetical protein
MLCFGLRLFPVACVRACSELVDWLCECMRSLCVKEQMKTAFRSSTPLFERVSAFLTPKSIRPHAKPFFPADPSGGPRLSGTCVRT